MLLYVALALVIAAAVGGLVVMFRRNSDKNAPPAKKHSHTDQVFKM